MRLTAMVIAGLVLALILGLTGAAPVSAQLVSPCGSSPWQSPAACAEYQRALRDRELRRLQWEQQQRELQQQHGPGQFGRPVPATVCDDLKPGTRSYEALCR